mmetsp:Transcript_453/g.1020  ORF Transcript_453/g.1020 Transcript_453/m.1020 type:complete len:104 (-) Transcript_453:1133-1444(-)
MGRLKRVTKRMDKDKTKKKDKDFGKKEKQKKKKKASREVPYLDEEKLQGQRSANANPPQSIPSSRHHHADHGTIHRPAARLAISHPRSTPGACKPYQNTDTSF